MNAAAALALAQTTLATDSDLSNEYGLSGGEFDAAGMQLLDPAGGNDWFIPYLKSGSYTGVFMLSAHYGILEEASWDEAGETPTSLANLQLEYQGLEEGFNPNDNPVPEASTRWRWRPSAR